MEFFSAVLMLFFLMDPVGNIPFFTTVLQVIPEKDRPKVLRRELFFAYIIMVAFLMAGPFVMSKLGIDRGTLGIAGGLILLTIAIRMVFPERSPKGTGPSEDEEPFIVPLAVPMLAGPSLLAMLLLLISREPTRWLEWLGALTLAWAVAAGLLLASGTLFKLIGRKGLRALERLVGMLLIMMSVQMLIDGIREELTRGAM